MKTAFHFILILLLRLVSIQPSWAQETYEAPEVVVWGEDQEELSVSQGSSTYVKTEKLEHRSLNLPELLSQQPGVHLKRYGSSEQAATISIRGSSSDEVLFFLDGIPLQTADESGLDLSMIQLDALESVEIHRGFAPLSYGFAPAAGSIQLNSKKIEPGFHRAASLSYGSFQTLKAHGNFSLKKKKLGLLFSLGANRSQGNFKFKDTNGTPINLSDDQVVERQNNQSWTLHPYLKLEYDPSLSTKLIWVQHFLRKHQGIPGINANQSQSAQLDRYEYLTSFRFQKDGWLKDSIFFESTSYFRWIKTEFEDLLGEIGLGGAQDNDNDTLVLGEKLFWEWKLNSNHQLSWFGLYHFETFKPEDALATPSEGGRSLRHQLNFGVSYQGKFWQNRISLKPSVWFQNVFNQLNNDDPSLLTPATFENNRSHHDFSAKLALRARLFSGFFLEGHVARGYRYPSFAELFGDRGGVVGNPSLNPQESVSWDLGIHYQKMKPKAWVSQSQFSFTFYDRYIDELIQYQQAAGFVRANNIGQAHLYGVEALAFLEFKQMIRLSMNYTYQQAKDRATNAGRFLTGRPQHELDAQVEFKKNKFRSFFHLNWMDEYYLDPLNTQIIQDRVILNAGVSYKPVDPLELSLEAKNLTDDQIVDVVGFPLPGRSFWAKISFQYR